MAKCALCYRGGDPGLPWGQQFQSNHLSNLGLASQLMVAWLISSIRSAMLCTASTDIDRNYNCLRPTVGAPNSQNGFLVGIVLIFKYSNALFCRYLVVAQGIILIFLYANQLKHIYPAFAVFVPVGIWIGYHLPRLLAFGDPSVAWYQVLGPIHLLTIVGYILNSLSSVSLLIVSALMIRSYKGPVTNIVGREVSLSALASLLSFAAIVILGMIKPSFSLRYCVPFVPGILLGFAIIIQWHQNLGLNFRYSQSCSSVRRSYSILILPKLDKRTPLKRLLQPCRRLELSGSSFSGITLPH